MIRNHASFRSRRHSAQRQLQDPLRLLLRSPKPDWSPKDESAATDRACLEARPCAGYAPALSHMLRLPGRCEAGGSSLWRRGCADFRHHLQPEPDRQTGGLHIACAMSAAVSVHMGDVFEGGADLTVLPCGANPSWTPSVQRWIDRFELPTPKQLMPEMRLSDVTPLAPFGGPKGITNWICYGASVFNDYTNVDAIRGLGANIGKITSSRLDIKIVECVLFGTGYGRLGDVPAALALAEGFIQAADPSARLMIFLHGAARYDAVRRALEDKTCWPSRRGADPGGQMNTDCVILTAIKREILAVLSQFRHFHQVTLAGTVSFPCFETIAPNGLLVTAVSPTAMGTLAIASLAHEVISALKPKTVLLVGIAGGMDKEIALGDVVVSEQIVDYELGKVTGEGYGPRWSVYRPDAALLARAKAWPNQSGQQYIRAPRPVTGASSKLHSGIFLTGNKVIADENTAGALRSVWQKAAAVDMEAAGVASALYHMNDPPAFLVFKGICDYADSKKNDDWQEYAAEAAASCAFSFVLEHLRPSDLHPGRTEAHATSGARGRNRALREALAAAYNVAELKQLVFDLGIDWEDIPGESKSERIIELLRYVQRRPSKYEGLVALVNNERDNILRAYSG
jgi:nucleoside phosphorylase